MAVDETPIVLFVFAFMPEVFDPKIYILIANSGSVHLLKQDRWCNRSPLRNAGKITSTLKERKPENRVFQALMGFQGIAT